MTSEQLDVRILKGKVVHDVIFESLPACVDVVRDAYLAHAAKETLNPASYFLRFPEKPSSRIIALPAYLGNRFDVAGLKWIASFPSNVERGFPRASALLILNDYETGYPFAILESSIISAARTAASAVLAAEHLVASPKRSRTLGIVGTGLIARYLYQFFLGTSWQIEHVRVFDKNPAESQRFTQNVCQTAAHGTVTVAASAEELLRECDLVALTTTAPSPYLNDAELLIHRPVVLNVSLRDLGVDLILASQNIVDDIDHVLTANTSPHLAEQSVGHRTFIDGTLADVLLGHCRANRERPIIFSPFGLGVLDLAVGKWIFDTARQREDVIRLADFFFDLSR